MNEPKTMSPHEAMIDKFIHLNKNYLAEKDPAKKTALLENFKKELDQDGHIRLLENSPIYQSKKPIAKNYYNDHFIIEYTGDPKKSYKGRFFKNVGRVFNAILDPYIAVFRGFTKLGPQAGGFLVAVMIPVTIAVISATGGLALGVAAPWILRNLRDTFQHGASYHLMTGQTAYNKMAVKMSKEGNKNPSDAEIRVAVLCEKGLTPEEVKHIDTYKGEKNYTAPVVHVEKPAGHSNLIDTQEHGTVNQSPELAAAPEQPLPKQPHRRLTS